MKKEYRNVVRTKKMIKTAFVELLGEKKNINAITVSELCNRANIAKSTFYNYYGDLYSVAEEFENELIDRLSAVLDEVEVDQAPEYDAYVRKVISFLKENEDTYKKAVLSSDVRFFIEKLKSIISKRVFSNSVSLPLSQSTSARYVQIRFLTNALIDTMADYFRGSFDTTLDQTGEVAIELLRHLTP